MKANKGQIERALDAPDGSYSLFLLYGPDESGTRAQLQRLVRAMGPEAERIDLDGPTLKADPARLADEAASFSLFGDKRFIVVSVGSEDILASIEALIESGNAENPVAIIAGALKPTSALIKRLLTDPKACCFASYAPEGDDFAQIAMGFAQAQGLRLDIMLARRMVGLSGNDRAVLSQEIEKLALYLDASPGAPKEALADDIDAISAANDEPDLSGLTDAVMNGRADAMADQLAGLAAEGIEGIAVLRALNRKVQLLIKMRAEMASGKSIETVTASVFFKDRRAVASQLQRWTPDRLAIAASRLMEAERAIKASRSAGPILADAELVAIARAARR